jgi:hypothetical protein
MSIRNRYRKWNRLSYLSDFERRLNRLLWASMWIALIYALFQHIFLANIPEQFPGGERLGELLYDLVIAYSVAFIFYLLVVRLPTRRDRANIYRLIQPLTIQIIYEAQNLMVLLTRAAGIMDSRPNSRENVGEVCKTIGLASPAYPLLQGLWKPAVPEALAREGIDDSPTVADVIDQTIRTARDLNREVLGFASMLSSEIVNLIAWIDGCHFFLAWNAFVPYLHRKPKPNLDLTILADDLFKYLQLVELLNRYREEFLPGKPLRPSELSGITDPLNPLKLNPPAVLW